MKLSRQLKTNLSKVAIITIVYLLINLFIFFFNYALINSPYTLGPSALFIDSSYFLTNILIGLIAGVLGGVLLVWVNSHLFRTQSFKFAMFTTLIAYVLIFVIVTLSATFANLLGEHGLQGISFDSIKTALGLVLNLTLITYFILWGAIILFTLFLLQVSDKFGPGILLKFIAGNYHQPNQEKRIFMFLDMKSSTTIAEAIGHECYFELLKRYYADMTNAILETSGEVYQYVGDEIVVTWKEKKGIDKNNCIHCFIKISEAINKKKDYYIEQFGLVPKFKAGFHIGEVTAGEIGIIKKDIIYTGDVLNTTARIQSECNAYNSKVLISEELSEKLENEKHFSRIKIDNLLLKGKNHPIQLYKVAFN